MGSSKRILVGILLGLVLIDMQRLGAAGERYSDKIRLMQSKTQDEAPAFKDADATRHIMREKAKGLVKKTLWESQMFLKQPFKNGDGVAVVSTTYYGPLKGQKKYANGSYRADVRLNGKGVYTYSGKQVRVGHIAADPRVFPFGTVLEIPGYGYGVVEDIGFNVKGYRIDLFMGHGEHALAKAVRWERRRVMVKVVRMGGE